jgi:hypothetical protein
MQPIPHVDYVVLALASGMDSEPPVHAPRRRWGLTALAALLFAFLSWEMVADHLAHLGDWGRSADMCPWELSYCEHVSDMAVKSAWRHRGNPLAYPRAIQFLHDQGNNRISEVLARIENRMDRNKLCR